MKHRKEVVFLLITLVVILLDQITKSIVRNTFQVGQTKGIFTYIQNTGAGFGILKGMNGFLIAVSILIIVFIIYYYHKIHEHHKAPVGATAFIIGGAVGNLIDRIIHGFVIDFIDFGIWPAFNIADSAITIGAVVLIFYFWQK